MALYVRAENQLLLGERGAARQSLEEATAAAPGRFLKALEALAALYEGESLYDLAIARYREIVKLDSRNVAGLNNLAYALAIRKNEPSEALPLAQRARVLAPRNAAVIDTLGWIYFLLGDVRQATTLVEQAVRLAPRSSDLQLHLARIYKADGRLAEARVALERALAVNPSLAADADVKALQELLR